MLSRMRCAVRNAAVRAAKQCAAIDSAAINIAIDDDVASVCLPCPARNAAMSMSQFSNDVTYILMMCPARAYVLPRITQKEEVTCAHKESSRDMIKQTHIYMLVFCFLNVNAMSCILMMMK